MIWILIGVYLWAGATTIYALWLFEIIGETIGNPNLKSNLGATTGTIIFVLWPLVLLIWVAREAHGKNILTTTKTPVKSAPTTNTNPCVGGK